MSLRALPILLTCLGGEMLYILQQRLEAHNVETEKAEKVHQEIISCLFEESLFSDILKPQEMYTVTSVKRFCSRLAHSSIMRLSENGLSKLFDLMLMAVKYQTVCCTHPRELLFVVLNHLDAMRVMLEETQADTSKVSERLETIAAEMVAIYETQNSVSEQYLLRTAVLAFCQPYSTGVTNFIRGGIQSSYDGSFIVDHPLPLPPFGELPGRIRYLDRRTGAVIREETFEIDMSPGRLPPVVYESFPGGKRGTELGKNLFLEKPVVESREEPQPPASVEQESKSTLPTFTDKKMISSEREVHMLREMLVNRVEDFHLDLFSDLQFDLSDQSTKPEDPPSQHVRKPPVVIAHSAGTGHLNKIMEGFKVANNSRTDTNELGDDLLNLLDS